MANLEKEEAIGVGCEKEEEEEKLIEGVSVLDFDVLCSTVAMQSQGKWRLFDNEEEGGEVEEGGNEYSSGVFRMWEGEVLDCFDDHRIAIETFCCPCYRFGKNMRRGGLGPCFVQGAVYFLLAAFAFITCVAFIVTRRRCFLYLAIALTMSVASYLGFYRTRMRKKFNIRMFRKTFVASVGILIKFGHRYDRWHLVSHSEFCENTFEVIDSCSDALETLSEGSDNSVDDCVYHLICPCCTLCQESRTLEMNNVQGGTWHGRGDTICIGSFGEGGKSFVELHPPLPISTQFPETTAPPKSEADPINQC